MACALARASRPSGPRWWWNRCRTTRAWRWAWCDAGVNTPESLRKDARALRDVLDEVAKLPGVDAARIAEVRAEIAALTSNQDLTSRYGRSLR